MSQDLGAEGEQENKKINLWLITGDWDAVEYSGEQEDDRGGGINGIDIVDEGEVRAEFAADNHIPGSKKRTTEGKDVTGGEGGGFQGWTGDEEDSEEAQENRPTSLPVQRFF